MPTCKSCGDEVDQLVSVKVDGKTKKLCEDCADRAREAAEVAEASESAVQNMMGFKGRRGACEAATRAVHGPVRPERVAVQEGTKLVDLGAAQAVLRHPIELFSGLADGFRYRVCAYRGSDHEHAWTALGVEARARAVR